MLLTSQPASDAGGALVLLLGTAVNQGGRASGLTAPNGPSQQEAVRLALRSAAVAVSGLAGLQLHGTGTSLGDPIEVGAVGGELPARREPVLPMLPRRDSADAQLAAGVLHVQAWCWMAEPLRSLCLPASHILATASLRPA